MPQSPVPQILAALTDLLRDAPARQGGALWRLAAPGRQLDANLIRLAPGERVAEHVEPDLDVLVFVVAGGGGIEGVGPPLREGGVLWLPRGSRRAVAAGPDGLAYLTVHRRRPGLSIGTRTARPAPVPREGGEAACLLDRVCAECGRLAGEPDARFCCRCGTALPTG